jgi:hypothetical protein
MRQKNWPLIITGIVMIVLAVGLFFGMSVLVAQGGALPSDLEKTGGLSGTAIGVALAMLVYGLIGKKV